MAHMVFCTKYKAELEGWTNRRSTPTSAKIYKNCRRRRGRVGGAQKMLLNEYRLQPWTREAQDFLVEQMNGFSLRRGGRRRAAEGVRGAEPLGNCAEDIDPTTDSPEGKPASCGRERVWTTGCPRSGCEGHRPIREGPRSP